jgi:hypothetical protein
MTSIAQALQQEKTTNTLYNHVVIEGRRLVRFQLDAEIFSIALQHLRGVFIPIASAFARKSGAKITNTNARLLFMKIGHLLYDYKNSGKFNCSKEGFNAMEDELWVKFCKSFEVLQEFETLYGDTSDFAKAVSQSWAKS